MTPPRTLIAEGDAMIAMPLSELQKGLEHAVCDFNAEEVATLLCHPDLVIGDDRSIGGGGIKTVLDIERSVHEAHIRAIADCIRILEAKPNAIVPLLRIDPHSSLRMIAAESPTQKPSIPV